MIATAIEWREFLGTTPLSIAATLCSVAGVILIALQKQLGWALGIIWAGISAYLAWEWQLVSDAILYVSYIPIQIYCWHTWRRRPLQDEIAPSYLPAHTRWILCVAMVIAVVIWGISVNHLAATVSWIPTPALLWRDSTSTVLNYFAQFLQAKKRMENWILWLVVNLLGIHIYWFKGIPIYSFQYAMFLCLGIFGFIAWRRAMQEEQSPSP
jgi:nicotinamide mononucleotide transporter